VVVLALLLGAAACGGGGSGSGDASFNRVRGLDGNVSTIATDQFDRIWLGGAFDAFDDQRAAGVLRLLPSGEIDTTFATGTGFDGSVAAVAPLSDGSGRAVVVGSFTNFDGAASPGIALVLDGGALDPTFQPGTGFQGSARALAFADDGSGDVWVGGLLLAYDGTPVRHLVRLATDGTLVLAVPIGNFGPNDTVLALAATGDGSGDVYVGGSFASFAGAPTRSIVRVRGTTGAPVTTFDVGTGLELVASPASTLVWSIALAEDSSGDLFVGGSFDRYDGDPVENLVRLRPDGSRVATFAAGGGPSGSVQAVAPAVDGSGDLWIAGAFGPVAGNQTQGIARLAPDGAFEPSFDVGDLRITGGATAISVAPGGSGDVLLGGSFATFGGPLARFYARFDADGSVDPSTPESGGLFGAARDVLPLPGGRVLVAGDLVLVDGVEVPNLVELSANGALTRPFQTVIGTPTRLVRDLADPANVYATGPILRYGSFDTNGAVRIRLADAEPVTSFVLLPAPFGPDLSISDAIGVEGGGLLVNGPYTTWDGGFVRNLVRLDEAGQDYGNNGFNDGTVAGYAYTDDGSGRLWVVGTFSQWTGAFTPAPRVGLLQPVADFFFEPDPGFAAGAGFGSVDGFDTGQPRTLAVVPGTAKALIAGDFTSYDGQPVGRIVRLLPDGSIDPTFDAGDGFDGAVELIALAADGSGDVYVSGDFTSYDGVPVSNFVRLDADGALDTRFANTTGFNGTVRRIAPLGQGSRKLYVAGSFSSYDGVATGSVVRLAPDGSVD
jgi:hypothetical protein